MLLSDPQAEAEAIATLTIDESLSNIEKFEKYSASDIALQRLFQVRGIHLWIENINHDIARSIIVPAFERLVLDPEPAVRQELARKLPTVIQYFLKEDTGEQNEIERFKTLFPVLSRLLCVDSSEDVNRIAETSFIQVCGFINKLTLERSIFPYLTSFEQTERDKCLCAKMLCILAPSFRQLFLEENVIPHIVMLGKDSVSRVRKEVCIHFTKASSNISLQVLTSKIIPLLQNFVSDEIWNVRQASAESITNLSENVSEEIRFSLLLPMFQSLLSDGSRWVSKSASLRLGKFLSTLPRNKISQQLLNCFTQLSNQNNGNEKEDSDNNNNIDRDLSYSCAYYFPAVLQTVGSDRWSELSVAYESLSKNPRWQIRCSIASSISVIGGILGEEITEKILFPILRLFLHDIDPVRFAALENYSNLLKILKNEEQRKPYLLILNELKSEVDNWRFRKVLAEELIKLPNLLTLNDCADILFKISFSLCADPFAKIRLIAADSLAAVTQRLCQNEDKQYLNSVLNSICSLSKHHSYHARLTFALFCGKVSELIDPSLFENFFLNDFLELSKDEIPNVRFTVAKQIIEKLIQKDYFIGNSKINEMISILSRDKDTDVVFFSNPDSITDVLLNKDLPKYVPFPPNYKIYPLVNDVIGNSSGNLNSGKFSSKSSISGNPRQLPLPPSFPSPSSNSSKLGFVFK